MISPKKAAKNPLMDLERADINVAKEHNVMFI